jgi:hypothetical protein
LSVIFLLVKMAEIGYLVNFLSPCGEPKNDRRTFS